MRILFNSNVWKHQKTKFDQGQLTDKKVSDPPNNVGYNLPLNRICILGRSWIYSNLVAEESPLYIGVHSMIATTTTTTIMIIKDKRCWADEDDHSILYSSCLFALMVTPSTSGPWSWIFAKFKMLVLKRNLESNLETKFAPRLEATPYSVNY